MPLQAQKPAAQPGAAPATATGGSPALPAAAAEAPTLTRAAALETTPRVPVDSAKVSGSINLHGGRIDDVRLKEFHETVDASSPTIVLLSPSGTPEGYFAEFGWVAATGHGRARPGYRLDRAGRGEAHARHTGHPDL